VRGNTAQFLWLARGSDRPGVTTATITRPARFLRRSVFLRELLPQDRKLEIDYLTRSEAINAARFLAGVVGSAHARQLDGAARKAWHHARTRNHS
jgi:Uncharacterized protein conserved in bacteria (DUF2252)